MLCLINKRKLKVHKALKDLVVKFVVLSRIIFVFYCFKLINSHRGFPFLQLSSKCTCLQNIEDLAIIFLFYLRKYKEEGKKNKFWKFLKLREEKVANANKI